MIAQLNTWCFIHCFFETTQAVYTCKLRETSTSGRSKKFVFDEPFAQIWILSDGSLDL